MISPEFYDRVCQFCNISKSRTDAGKEKIDSERMLDNVKYLIFICQMKGYKISFLSQSADLHEMKGKTNFLIGKCTIDGNTDEGFLKMKFRGLEEVHPENEDISGYFIIEKPLFKGFER